MKQKFRETKLNAKSMEHLTSVNDIIEDYKAQGYKLTLRQLYYQLVSRNIIANHDREYKKLSRVLTEGRMAGLVDWDAIEDRLRRPQTVYTVDDIPDALEDTYRQYRLNRQKDQLNRVEVWVEKDAISNVLKRVTEKYGVPILVNRGYGSVTAIKDAYDRFSWRLKQVNRYGGVEKVTILYLGDHDPSGLDMVRDINSRVGEMLNYDGYSSDFEIKPIALTMDQIKEHKPPPNPAKTTDNRSPEYIKKFGKISWEVDALKPEILTSVLTEAIESEIDMTKYNKIVKRESKEKAEIKLFIDKYTE